MPIDLLCEKKANLVTEAQQDPELIKAANWNTALIGSAEV
jgi:hypothetical protein